MYPPLGLTGHHGNVSCAWQFLVTFGMVAPLKINMEGGLEDHCPFYMGDP